MDKRYISCRTRMRNRKEDSSKLERGFEELEDSGYRASQLETQMSLYKLLRINDLWSCDSDETEAMTILPPLKEQKELKSFLRGLP